MTFKRKLNEAVIFVDDSHYVRNKTKGYHNTAKKNSVKSRFHCHR